LVECFKALLEPETDENEMDRDAGLEVLAEALILWRKSVTKPR